LAAAAPGDRTRPGGLSPRSALLALGAIALLALALRALGFEWVFVDEDTVVFPPGDAHYHVRRSLQAWIHFPRVLLWDSYINFPDGAAISWPPLFDLVVAGAARLFVRDPARFDAFVAWVPPAIGVLALWPAYLLGARLGTRATGLGAALLLALLPFSVSYSRVGQLDHHSAVALIGGWLLYATVEVVDSKRARGRAALVLCIARVAMLLTWHGSLLYLVLVDVMLFVTAAIGARRDIHVVQAASAAGAWLVVAPLVWLFPEPLGGPYSAIALSRLHVLAMLGVALVSTGLFWLDRPREGSERRTPARRLGATAALGLGVAGLFLLLPGPREGLEPAFRFLTMTDAVGARTGEQLPLFSIFGRPSGRPVTEVWGFLAWLIPILPVGVVWGARPEAKRAAWIVAAFCLYFGVLATLQRRYGNDLGPSLAVAAAVSIAALSSHALRAVGVSRHATAPAAAAIGLLLLAPPIFGPYRARAASAVHALQGGYAGQDRALKTVSGSVTRFLEEVRKGTPPAGGFSDVTLVPQYGVVADPNLGHALQNVAERPTPTDPFWSFIGEQSWERAAALLSAENEAHALEMSEALGARYVVTMSSASTAGLEGWLHDGDGLTHAGRPRSEHFRLVTEGPRKGVPLAAAFRDGEGRASADTPPYKLFEIVNGALLEIRTQPGDEVRVALGLSAPARRKLVWRANERAGSDGVARVRVVYPTSQATASGLVHANGVYHIGTASGSLSAQVTEHEIATGSILRIDAR
jgi:dolichyl-diphosphooligosaccharide--protein glycosyltransferase